MSSIDWLPVLEFVKALAAPVATVLSVFLVSLLGVRAFRAQKALERRLDWYERAYSLLEKTERFYSELPNRVISTPENRAWLDESIKDANALRDHLGRSWLYADDDAHDAVNTLLDTIHQAHQAIAKAGHVLPDETRRVTATCVITSLRLSIGIRKHLGLPILAFRDEKVSGDPDG